MARLKFLNDNEMLKLKKLKFLDTVLAARRKKLGKKLMILSQFIQMKAWA